MWLLNALEAIMLDDDSVYDAVSEAEWENRHGDPDASHDRKLDDSLMGGFDE